jgi:hypothetical protein
MMLKIVASLTDDSRGIIYDCNIFIIKATAGAAAALRQKFMNELNYNEYLQGLRLYNFPCEIYI